VQPRPLLANFLTVSYAWLYWREGETVLAHTHLMFCGASVHFATGPQVGHPCLTLPRSPLSLSLEGGTPLPPFPKEAPTARRPPFSLSLEGRKRLTWIHAITAPQRRCARMRV